jgi:hypothetical protein
MNRDHEPMTLLWVDENRILWATPMEEYASQLLLDLMDDDEDPHDDSMCCLWCQEPVFEEHANDCPWPVFREAVTPPDPPPASPRTP